MGEIYKITNILNNNEYIGQTLKVSTNGRIMGYKKRFNRHIQNALRNYQGGCPKLENAIRKYGDKSFKIELLIECKEEELNYYEDFFINKFNTLHPNGYNLMSGGGNGRRHNKYTRDKMSKTRTGKTHSNITKERIGNSHKNKIVKEKSKNLMSKTKKEKNKKNYPEEIKEVLKFLELDILPMYIYYSYDNRPSRKNYYFIVRYPENPYKKFASKSISLIKNLEKAIEYKNTIINGHRS